MIESEYVNEQGKPAASAVREWCGVRLPDEHVSLLASMNGLVAHNGAFRLFGTEPPGEPLAAPPISFPSFRGDPVHVLWMVPITSRERALAQTKGGRSLEERLAAAGHGFVHRDRAEVSEMD